MKDESILKRCFGMAGLKSGLLAATAKFAMAASLGLSAVSAHASVSSLAMTVVSDGTATFDANDSAGNDSSATNGIARTLDKITYRVSYSSNSTANAKFVLTLPAGAAWESPSAAASVCNGLGGGSISGNTLTCNRAPVNGAESFEVTLVANTMANGAALVPTVSVDGSAPVSGAAVTISAAPEAVFQVYNNNSVLTATTMNGVAGQLLRTEFAIGIPKTSDPKGAESIGAGSTFEISMQPGAMMDPTSCTGTVSCSQPGGPGTPVTVTIIPQVNFNNTKDSSTFYTNFSPATNVAFYKELRIFVPNDPNFPVGQKSIASNQFSKFDPNSISGQSNFGSGFSNDMDPSFSCSTTTIIPNSYACNGQQVDRSTPNPNVLFPIFSLLTETATLSDLVYGDDSGLNGREMATSETIVPSQSFISHSGFTMRDSGISTISNAGICVVFNNDLMALDGVPYAKFADTFTNAFSATKNVASSDLLVEYSAKAYSSDAERRAASCGMAGDGAAGWSTDPNALGGQSSVTTVRIRYINGKTLVPGNGMVFSVPFKRTSTAASLALADQTVVPWFWHTSYTDDTTSTNQFANSTYSGAYGSILRGGRFTTQSTKVRHKISFSGPVAPGATVPMTITPQLIGAATSGVDSTAKNVSITTSFPDNCAAPVVASLPSGATFTAGDYGADGLPCTPDDGAPGTLTIALGDLVAPGGTATSPYGGHLTYLTPIVFNVLATSNASISTKTLNSVISSTNDSTPAIINAALSEDRTETTSLVVNGASSFSADKSTVGVTGGVVGPNESFGYAINFGNGGDHDSGAGYFVDVLPFDGDDNGTTGLGAGKFKVTNITAAMSTATMGGVSIQYSTDDSLIVQNLVKVPGQENGSVGINWINYSTGNSLPSNVTAIRFITQNPMLIGYSGVGTITLQAPTINSTSKFTNTVWARTELFNRDPASVQVIRSGSAVTVQGTDLGWNASTSKTSDSAAKESVRIGDTINYTITSTISGGVSTRDLVLTDTLGTGLTLMTIPAGCSASASVLTCTISSGAAEGSYAFTYSARVNEQAKNTVVNIVSPNYGSCEICSTSSILVLDHVDLLVTKTAKTKTAKIGDFVRYEVVVENSSQYNASDFNLVDQPAPGLSYVSGSMTIKGDDTFTVTSDYPLTTSHLDLAAGQKLTLSYLMRVGASAGQGSLQNCAQASDASLSIKSNRSCAEISRVSDPDFEDGRILGTVFEDSNGNGIQDNGESGIPGVRLATVEGLLIETDAYGRYHIEGINPGLWARGSNFIVKVDMATIPEGAISTTQNPLVKRLTQGLPGLFNFGFRVPFNTYEPGKPLSYPVMLSADGLFEFDRFDLLAAGRDKLTALAQQLKDDDRIKQGLKVMAYTDRLGSDVYNQKLSLKRAETIKAFLVSQGIDESLIAIKGMGAAQPLVECTGPKSDKLIQCLAPNRRFEVTLQ